MISLNKKNINDSICECKNGECVELAPTIKHCLCSLPFYGDKCQFKDVCYNNTCEFESQQCYQLPNNSLTCINTKNNQMNQIKEKINENLKNLTEYNSNFSSYPKNVEFNLTCPSNYCNSNGICMLNANDNSLIFCGGSKVLFSFSNFKCFGIFGFCFLGYKF
jgi:hypothetical protein